MALLQKHKGKKSDKAEQNRGGLSVNFFSIYYFSKNFTVTLVMSYKGNSDGNDKRRTYDSTE